MTDIGAGGMVEPSKRAEVRAPWHSTLASPRAVIYPAVLLLLAEAPRRGHDLLALLATFGFGSVDRPGIHRVVTGLERDRLLESWSPTPTARSARRVYTLTAAGRDALEAWMEVLVDERDHLDALLDRFAAVSARKGAPFG